MVACIKQSSQIVGFVELHENKFRRIVPDEYLLTSGPGLVCGRQIIAVAADIKVKADSSSWAAGNPISELRDVTCHIGTRSVTCHLTQVNASRQTPAIQAGTRFVDLIAPHKMM